VRIEVTRPATAATTIAQTLVRSGASPEDKRATLRRVIRGAENFKNALIFCNRKRDVQVVHRSLEKHGFSVDALHGDLDQRSRMAALDGFRNGQVQLLVCSDVAARGLDIPDVSHIYNFDVPHHADDYVHRIGRTGRAGRTGTAITLVAGGDDQKAVAAIEKLIGQPIPWMGEVPGVPSPAPAAEQHHVSAARQGSRPPRRGRSDNHRQPQPHRPAAAASPARIPQRPPQPAPSRSDDGDASHLPAFLLRPVTVKA
jgi:superfamily II DNA/RNA helicase